MVEYFLGEGRISGAGRAHDLLDKGKTIFENIFFKKIVLVRKVLNA